MRRLSCSLLAFVTLLGLTLASTVPKSWSIRPQSSVEDAAFWKAYAEKDLKRRVNMVKPNVNKAKNVILFLGDGMGIQTQTMARIYKGQLNGKKGEDEEMVWESFPSTGLSKTYNSNHQVPDSASTATAMVTGVKTALGVTGVGPGVTRNTCDSEVFEKEKLKGMLHWAMAEGKATGVVTNARITHASPSALYAHSTNRNWESSIFPNPGEDLSQCNDDIATQLVDDEYARKFNLFFGGGEREFLMEKDGGKRKDEDLLKRNEKQKEADGVSYRLLRTTGDLKKWSADGGTDHVLGLFSSSHMDYELERDKTDDGQPSLSQMVEAAIGQLEKDEDGFFLFVESGRIDHAHHDTKAKKALDETVELERAVQMALDNVDLEETLVIVTADHSHSVTFNGYPKRGNSIFGYIWDPSYSSGFIEFKDGVKRPYSTISYANGDGFEKHFTGDPALPWVDLRTLEGEFDDNDYTQPAMMPGPEGDETHGGEDVGIYAIGPKSHLLTGVHEQSYIAHAMAYAACVGEFAGDNCEPFENEKSSARK